MRTVFSIAETADDRIKALLVRCLVFCDEQRVPYEVEVDEFEDDALHVLGTIDLEPIAAGRIRFMDDVAKLERIAVRQGYRHNGIGSALMTFMIATARARGYSRMRMHAQSHLIDFYRNFGFKPVGDPFDEAGIEHIEMVWSD